MAYSATTHLNVLVGSVGLTAIPHWGHDEFLLNSATIQPRQTETNPGIRAGTETSKQPIRIPYLGHVTDYQPIRDQYF